MFFLSHGFSFQGDLVGVVYESVQNGVGEGGIADGVVPVFEGELVGDEGGFSLVSVFVASTFFVGNNARSIWPG